jgi:putative Mg2+ transporter-C (MgtC) family protein
MKLFLKNRTWYKRIKQTKSGEFTTGHWTVHGTEKNHNKFIRQILHDEAVKEFEF